jgi:hypothetical protein
LAFKATIDDPARFADSDESGQSFRSKADSDSD